MMICKFKLQEENNVRKVLYQLCQCNQLKVEYNLFIISLKFYDYLLTKKGQLYSAVGGTLFRLIILQCKV